MNLPDPRAFKKAIEDVQPNLRGYYKMPVRGRITAVYNEPGDGPMLADVEILLGCGQPNPKEPRNCRVEITHPFPGPFRGLIGGPKKGDLCVLSFYEGDPSDPYISSWRQKPGDPHSGLPEHAVRLEVASGVAIQLEPDGAISIETLPTKPVRIAQKLGDTEFGVVKIDDEGEVHVDGLRVRLGGGNSDGNAVIRRSDMAGVVGYSGTASSKVYSG